MDRRVAVSEVVAAKEGNTPPDWVVHLLNGLTGQTVSSSTVDADLSGEFMVVVFNLILSFGCSTCILIGTWPFGGMMASWFWTKYRYTWTTHVMLTWFDVGCIGLFTTNLYTLLSYPSISRELSASGVQGGLPFAIWQGNFAVNMIMQGLWGTAQS